MFEDDGKTRNGLWLMIEAPDRAAAEVFIASEAFSRAGMFDAIEITRFRDTASETPRQTGIAADPARVMFVCECGDGRTMPADEARFAPPDIANVRLIVGGLTVSDDALIAIGMIAIVEVADRATAEAYLAAAPLVQAGAWRRRRIDPWRFGKSIV